MTDTYTFWLTLAVVIGAVALAAQAACIFALYRAFKQLQDYTVTFLPKAQMTLERADQSLADSRREMAQLTGKANHLMDIVTGSAGKVDDLISETSGRARVQIDRVEALLDDTIGRTRHTVALINDTATRPVRELNAVSAGLRAALGVFLSRHAPSKKAERRSEEEKETVAEGAARTD